jgi:hypothetical protein
VYKRLLAEFLKWMPNYGYTERTVFGGCGLVHPVTTVQKFPTY